MNVDDLELELRKLPGVRAAGFTERDDVLLIQLQVSGESPPPNLPLQATRIAYRHSEKPVALEVVRWRVSPEPRRPRARSGLAARGRARQPGRCRAAARGTAPRRGPAPTPEPAIAEQPSIAASAGARARTRTDHDRTDAGGGTGAARGRGAGPPWTGSSPGPSRPAARGADVPGHRRARGAPHVRGPPHHRAGGREQRDPRRGGSDGRRAQGVRAQARFRPSWARVLDDDGRDVHVVACELLAPDDSRRLGIASGASAIEAAARATLHALNRAVARLLAEDPEPEPA